VAGCSAAIASPLPYIMITDLLRVMGIRLNTKVSSYEQALIWCYCLMPQFGLW